MAKANQQHVSGETTATDSVKDTPVCGIIMPIANTVGYPDGHWQNVYDILCESATLASFEPNLVSFDDDVGIIQNRIVQNIYTNPIVVCDISSRNPNVMFELGMRLAFDKPTIIIKDEKTPYSFDISPIEHLTYPSDLRYQAINEFKLKLQGKIKETYQKSISDKNYTTFLKHFGTFKVAHLEEREISETQFIASELKELRKMFSNMYLHNKNIIGDERYNSSFNGSTLSKTTQGFHFPIPIKYNLIDVGGLVNHLSNYGVEVMRITKGRNEESIDITISNVSKKSFQTVKELVWDFLSSQIK